MKPVKQGVDDNVTELERELQEALEQQAVEDKKHLSSGIAPISPHQRRSYKPPVRIQTFYPSMPSLHVQRSVSMTLERSKTVLQT